MIRDNEELIRKTILNIEPYVPGKPAEEVKRELGLTRIIKLASNENSHGPSPRVVEVMQQACQHINVYPDANSFELKEAIANRYGLTRDHIILGNGSDENIKMIAQAFLNPGEEVICGYPSFSAYDFVGRLMDGKVTKVPLRDHTYDLEAILAQVSAKTKLIFICNPNNPTGTWVGSAEVARFLQRLPDHVITVFDEAYAEYVEDPDFPNTIDYIMAEQKVISLRTFSKIYGLAGIRVGYGLASPQLIGYLERVREPFNINLVAQKGAQEAIGDQEYLKHCKEKNRQGMAYITGELGKLGLTWIKSQANFLLVDVQVDSKKLFQELLKLGMIIRPGYVWGLDNYIRVTIGTAEENQQFIEMLIKALPQCGYTVSR